MKKNNIFYGILFVACFASLFTGSVFAQSKLPAEKAGQIGAPVGKIAFIREGNIWTFDITSSKLQMISETTNANGRLSWSPQNDKILFTRDGRVDLKGPDLLGGQHKVYDLFAAFPDSAANGNTLHWYRYTEDLGSRDPEWQTDGKIVFWKDMNSNIVNSLLPNYQIITMDENGDYPTLIRKDWQTVREEFLTSPSMNKNGDLACVAFFDLKPQGLVVLSKKDYMISMDSIKVMSRKNLKKVGPAWSPDGRWLAYIHNDLNSNGLYITTPDLKESYLVYTPPVSTYISSTAPSFSPDSKWITFATTDGAIWIVDITGNGARRITPPGTDRSPAWSK